MPRPRLIALIALGVVFVLAGVAVYFLRTYTAFLSPPADLATVRRNNENPTNQNINAANLLDLAPVRVSATAEQQTSVFTIPRYLNVPAEWTVNIFADGLEAPRFFDFTADGSLLVAEKGAGQIVMFTDADDDGVANTKKIVDRGLRNVHSVDVFEADVYVGEEHQIVVYRNLNAAGEYSQKQVLVSLPSGGGHVTRTVVIGPDRKMYVSIGSSCNLCEEKDERRASVMVFGLDGKNGRVFARGTRNSVGLAFQGATLWSVDNGRDLLGDDLPPEEVNRLEDGKHYGWPYCYGDGLANPEYSGRAGFCRDSSEGPVFSMQAHSAPLGLAVAPETFPGLGGNLVTAFHGSWNRTKKTGYKVVWVDPRKPATPTTNLISGWLDDSGHVWGRPVGVGFGPDGALYVSDDQAGVIYRVVPSALAS